MKKPRFHKNLLIILLSLILLTVAAVAVSAVPEVIFSYSHTSRVISTVIADFDGDGSGDVAFAGGTDMRARVAGSDGVLFYTSDPASGNELLDVDRLEVNGDGFDDLLVLSDYALATFDVKSGSPFILYQISAPSAKFWRNVSYIVTDDVNGDLQPDIIVTRYREGQDIHRVDVINASLGSLLVVSGWADYYPTALASGDINSDGLDEIFVGVSAGKVSCLEYQTSSGTLVSRFNENVLSLRVPSHIRLSNDIDGNGFKELVIATGLTTPGITNGIEIRDTSEGARLDYLFPADCGPIVSFEVADLNNDGTLEAVAGTDAFVDSSGTTITNYAVRIFSVTDPIQQVAVSTTLTGPVFVRVSDFDGDGTLEVAAVHTNYINLYNFDGTSLVQEETTQILNQAVTTDIALSVGRLNRDSVPDLAAGEVDGTVQGITFYQTPPLPQQLWIENRETTADIEQGTADAVFEILKLRSDQDTTVTSIRFKYLGNLQSRYISDLRLFYDSDGDGVFSSLDTTLATSTVSTDYVVFNLTLPVRTTTETLFLVGNVQSEAPVGQKFSFALETTADVNSYPVPPAGSAFPLYSTRHRVVDITAPETYYEPTISSPDGQNGWYRSFISIYLYTDEPGIIYYRFNDDDFAVYNGPYTCPPGINTLQYYSVDLYGNRSPTQTVTIKYDVTAPEVPAGLQAQAENARTVRLVWRPSIDKQPGSGLAYYEIYRDGVKIGTVMAGTNTYSDLSVLPNHTYSYCVRAVDAAGNISAECEEVKVKTPPESISLPVVSVTSQADSNLITWTSISSTLVAGIDIYRSGVNSGSSDYVRLNTVSLPSTATFYEDLLSDAEKGGKYYYFLSFKDDSGNLLANTPPLTTTFISVSESVDSSGAVVASSDGAVSVDIPAGALSSPELISIQTTSTTVPADVTLLSDLYQCGPSGLSFARAATVTLSFTGAAAVSTDLVRVGVNDGTGWNLVVPQEINLTDSTVSVVINHFSVFGVFYLGTDIDIEPPAIEYARSASPSKLFLTFDEFIDTSSVAAAVFEVSETTVTTAYPFKDGKTVVIETVYIEPTTEHTVTVTGIRDLAGNLIVDDGVSNVATFTVASPPHGKYLDDTNKCSLCHSVHMARNQKLLVKKSATEVCYICHDTGGSGSKYAVQQDFENPAAASVHHSREGDTGVYCVDCHSPHRDPLGVPRLLKAKGPQATTQTTATTAESFCFACHGTDGTLPYYMQIKESSYTTGIHYAALPGPSSGSGVTCMHCHESHASLMPTLMRGGTEEEACIACHRSGGVSPESGQPISAPDVYTSLLNAPDATAGVPGFEPTRTVWFKHPTLEYTGRHTLMEMFDATLSAQSQSTTETRHAECEDCHNPHYAGKTIYRQAPAAPPSITGAAGVQVSYPYGTTEPVFTFIPYGSITFEYELCFRCHSSYAKAWYGQDLAMVMSPYNGSYHPVLAPGKNDTTAVANSLIGLSPTSQILCSDCHFSAVETDPRGPHGSSYPFILARNYLFEIKETTISDDYDRSQFELCYQCHSSLPFEDKTGLERTDTNFIFHGTHLRNLYNNPAGNTVDGGIRTPGAGKGNAICRECHYNQHGTTGPRLVEFAPNVLGPNGEVGGAQFSPRTEPGNGYCLLTCHGRVHDENNSLY